MMNARAAVSCGWAFVKGIMWLPFSYLNALVKNPPLFPEAKDIFFKLNKVDLSIYFSEHG